MEELSQEEMLFNIRTLEGYLHPMIVVLPAHILVKHFYCLVLARNIYLGSDVIGTLNDLNKYLKGELKATDQVRYLINKGVIEDDWMLGQDKINIHEEIREEKGNQWREDYKSIQLTFSKLRKPTDIDLSINVSALLFITYSYPDLFIDLRNPWEYHMPEYEKIHQTMLDISKLDNIVEIIDKVKSIMHRRADSYRDKLGKDFVLDIYHWYNKVMSSPFLDASLRMFLSTEELRDREKEVKAMIKLRAITWIQVIIH
jgi:hypothetical protein